MTSRFWILFRYRSEHDFCFS